MPLPIRDINSNQKLCITVETPNGPSTIYPQRTNEYNGRYVFVRSHVSSPDRRRPVSESRRNHGHQLSHQFRGRDGVRELRSAHSGAVSRVSSRDDVALGQRGCSDHTNTATSPFPLCLAKTPSGRAGCPRASVIGPGPLGQGIPLTCSRYYDVPIRRRSRTICRGCDLKGLSSNGAIRHDILDFFVRTSVKVACETLQWKPAAWSQLRRRLI